MISADLSGGVSEPRMNQNLKHNSMVNQRFPEQEGTQEALPSEKRRQ